MNWTLQEVMNIREAGERTSRSGLIVIGLLSILLTALGSGTSMGQRLHDPEGLEHRTEGCGCDYETPVSDSVVVVDDLAELQYAINDAVVSTTILVSPGFYDLRTSPYAGSGIGIQVGNHDITIRSETGNREDVVFDAGGMGTGLGKAFMVSDYLTGRDSLRNITLADFTIQNAANHLISVQGEFHQRNLVIHNVHLINSGEQLIKVNPASLSNPTPVSNGTISCCRLEYETHLDEGWYTQGIDIHSGDHWIVRNNHIQNIRAHPDAGRIAGFAILVWTNSVGTIVERNVIVDCDRGISFGDWGHSEADFLDHTGGVIRNNVIKGYEDENPEGLLGSYEALALTNAVYAVVANNSVYSPGDVVRGIDLVGPKTRFNQIINNVIDKEITIRAGATSVVNTFTTNLEHAGASNYVDVAGLDFHLVPDSPAVDAGTFYTEQCADIDCEQVDDGALDIGADERSGIPYDGAACDPGYPGEPIDPDDLGRLFDSPRPLPPYSLCACEEIPDTPGAIVDTMSNLADLQNLLYTLHVENDNTARTIYLESGDYYIGQSPFHRVQIYTSNLTIRSLTGNREDVVLYGSPEIDFGLYLESYGARDIENVTIADLTIRDVERNAIFVSAYGQREDNLLFHNVALINSGEAQIYAMGQPSQGSSAVLECSLVEQDSLREPGWASSGVEIECGTDWVIRNSVFRDLRLDQETGGDPRPGHAIRAWNSSVGTRVERNIVVDCSKGVLFGDLSHSNDHLGGRVAQNAFRGHDDENPDGSFGSGTVITLANCRDAVVLNNSIFAPAQPARPTIEIAGSGSIGNLLQNNLLDDVIDFVDGASQSENFLVTNIEEASDADFADAAGEDLHLVQGSIAIDAGTLHDPMLEDVDCTPVTDGIPDVGADEFDPTASVYSGHPSGTPLQLLGNRPNPFHPGTSIEFDAVSPVTLDLRIYDAAGRLVRTLLSNELFQPGRHGVVWDGRTDRGSLTVAGVYFYRLWDGTTVRRGRMLLIH